MTLYEHALQFRGLREIPGARHHPWIVWAFTLCGLDATDEDAWCSAAMNGWAYGVPGCPRSKSARARSWLNVGVPIALEQARIAWDVLIFQRGEGPQPGPEVIAAPGHVALFAGRPADPHGVLAYGGNQSNEANVARFPVTTLLGVRRLREPCGGKAVAKAVEFLLPIVSTWRKNELGKKLVRRIAPRFADRRAAKRAQRAARKAARPRQHDEAAGEFFPTKRIELCCKDRRPGSG